MVVAGRSQSSNIGGLSFARRTLLLERTWQNDDIVNAPPFDAISMNLEDL